MAAVVGSRARGRGIGLAAGDVDAHVLEDGDVAGRGKVHPAAGGGGGGTGFSGGAGAIELAAATGEVSVAAGDGDAGRAGGEAHIRASGVARLGAAGGLGDVVEITVGDAGVVLEARAVTGLQIDGLGSQVDVTRGGGKEHAAIGSDSSLGEDALAGAKGVAIAALAHVVAAVDGDAAALGAAAGEHDADRGGDELHTGVDGGSDDTALGGGAAGRAVAAVHLDVMGGDADAVGADDGYRGVGGGGTRNLGTARIGGGEGAAAVDGHLVGGHHHL